MYILLIFCYLLIMFLFKLWKIACSLVILIRTYIENNVEPKVDNYETEQKSSQRSDGPVTHCINVLALQKA